MAKKLRISKVYTKFGDKGKTMLVGGETVLKSSEKVASYGDIDELNSVIGLSMTGDISKDVKKILSLIQNDLFIIGADLASNKETKVPRIKKARISWQEKNIDKYNSKVGPLEEFILPSGSFTGSCLHLARTVCRRAERGVTLLFYD